MKHSNTVTRLAAAIGTTLALSACGSGGGSGSDEGNGAIPPPEPGTPAAALERMAASGADPRFAAFLSRSDSARVLSDPTSPWTYVEASFVAVGEGDGARLVELSRRIENVSLDRCLLDGRYDGIDYADTDQLVEDVFGDDTDLFPDLLRPTSAGERLPVVDDAGSWDDLVLDDSEPGFPWYDLEDGSFDSRAVVGTLSVDVPGDAGFPGLGPVALPAAEPLVAQRVGTDERGHAPIDAALRWTPGTSAGASMFVEYAVLDDRGELFIECRTADDGEFALPEETLLRLPGTLTAFEGIYLSRQAREARLIGDVLVSTTGDVWVDVLAPDPTAPITVVADPP